LLERLKYHYTDRYKYFLNIHKTYIYFGIFNYYYGRNCEENDQVSHWLEINFYLFLYVRRRTDESDLIKHSMLATLLRNRKEIETANGVSRRKLAASEFSFLNFVSLSSMLLLTFAGIHSLAVNAVSIFLVNRDLGASGVTVRQITVINDLDYRYNRNAAESADQRWRRKEIGTKKELLKNIEASSGVRRIVRETHVVHIEVARSSATTNIAPKIGENIAWTWSPRNKDSTRVNRWLIS